MKIFRKPSDANFERHIKPNNIVMMLRKITMHPYLIEYPLDPKTGDYLIDANLIVQSGKMRVLDQLLEALKEGGHKVINCLTITSR